LSYLALDKPKEAAADLDEAARADPQNGQIWITRGLAYERLGDKTKATGSYGHAINRPQRLCACRRQGRPELRNVLV
jgi:Tfp pilus assembly protein PilF